ncbi:hypothetical protein ACJO5Y_00395 [Marinobacter sp. GN3S48]|uniref:hypothetical protein n=1 Tax=Marinobacter sp. GN3S48 TaxID=3382302 RepID=UPI00387B3BD1
MSLLKVINEGGQWIAIGVLLALLFSFDIDFFESAPKRVADLESRQTQQESRINSIEERLFQLESDVGDFTTSQSVGELQEQIDTLRSDLENLKPSDIAPTVSQSEITPTEAVATDNAEALQALPWYREGYVWMSAAAALVLLILLGGYGYVKKRKRKATLSVISRGQNDQSIASQQDCA